MHTAGITFDPTSLLSDSDKQLYSENSINKLRNELMHKFWDYLTIKLSQDLTEAQLNEVLDTVGYEQRAQALRKNISDFDTKVDKLIQELIKELKENN